MKKYIFTCLVIIALAGCGPARRAVKTERSSQSRDSLRIEQVRSDLTNSVKTLSDNSRIRIIYYLPERDSVTGEQLIDREEIRENNIVSKDSTSKKANENTNIAAGSALEEEIKEEIKEKGGLNWIQQTFMWIGIVAVLAGIVGVLKWFKVI